MKEKKDYKDPVEALSDIDFNEYSKIDLVDLVEEKNKSKWRIIWDDFTYELDHQWNRWFRQPYRNVVNGVSNCWKWRKIIWGDRWWDYYFLMRILQFKLKEMEKHWGVDTHYVNDLDDKQKLKELIEDLDWMLNDDVDDLTKDYEEEYKKRSKRFFGRLDRHHRKFWD